MGVCDLCKHLHLIEINCCINIKFHGIELWKEWRFWFWICGVVYAKSMVRKWCGILIIHRIERWEKIYTNIHNFSPKPTCDLQFHKVKQQVSKQLLVCNMTRFSIIPIRNPSENQCQREYSFPTINAFQIWKTY